jgi:hypothetical protein
MTYTGSYLLPVNFEYSDTFQVGLQASGPIALDLKVCQAKSCELSKLFEDVPMLSSFKMSPFSAVEFGWC